MEKKRFVTVAVGCHWLKIANYGGQGHSFNQQATLNIFNHPVAIFTPLHFIKWSTVRGIHLDRPQPCLKISD